MQAVPGSPEVSGSGILHRKGYTSCILFSFVAQLVRALPAVGGMQAVTGSPEVSGSGILHRKGCNPVFIFLTFNILIIIYLF
jgi:hypothetical protein